MRQVPSTHPKYGLIGSGKMARHISHYFNLLNIPHMQWSRKDSVTLKEKIDGCSHILLAISDDAIELFIDQNTETLAGKTLIHFSGAVSVNDVHSAHPLMTFSDDLYDLGIYKKVYFICDNKTDFKALFPNLNNKSLKITEDQKSFYHALIVMAGNFPQIIWSHIKNELHQKMDIPVEALKPYISQVVSNFISNPSGCLTGPLVRQDQETIKKHKKALKETHSESLYSAVCDLYTKEVGQIGEMI